MVFNILMTDQLKQEAERLEQLCLIAAEQHYAAETPWYHANYWFRRERKPRRS